MRPTRTAAVAAVLTAAVTGPFVIATPVTAAPAKLSDDFNGDGYRDLVVLGGTFRTDQRLTVVYGTSSGPGSRVQTIHQSSPGIPGTVEPDDQWGASATTADLDRDGYADLIVGTPGEDVGTITDQGGLTVIWGSAKGLGSGTYLGSPVEPPHETSGDAFGDDVVVGDFDGDGDLDLVASSLSDAGAVLLKGPFTRSGGYQGHETLGGDYPDRLYAQILVAGPVTADAATDLYILGTQLWDKDYTSRAYFHRGGADFTSSAASVPIPEPTPLDDGPGLTDAAIGDFDKDGHGDLAVGRGTKGEGWNPGYVVVQYGGSAGPDTGRALVTLTQDTPGIPGTFESGDYFGHSVAAGDVNGDGYADLAVGTPGEDIGTVHNGGAVTVLLGGARGLSGTGARVYDQDTSGVAGAVEAKDAFGRTVSLVDHTRDGRADLVVGTDERAGDSTGMVHLLKSSGSRITGTNSRHYTVNTLELPYDTFGYRLTR
ncbi:FG-GAP and VCBS repeat-containing protein [Streptomyces sp. UH6]|uniref:FG-GAP and VCBS repeat-containing protein n=1 Tax=Streptomyces sp. UH6 TaxID=2748379 RepID=UPI0015D509DF|nr:FG-GAP and VCBS repeat-containing protein [Streptomyces sp. UH6]NYV73365.1 VCBS repeat-containing protein [Streptomyces sp. UH6]